MKNKSLAAREAVRTARRGRKFGPDAVCVLCGFQNPIALTLVKQTLLEEHHVNGANFDDETRVPLCQNCHALITSGILDAGASMRPQRSFLERSREIHRARQVYYRAASEAEGKFATEADKEIAALDTTCPRWRSIQEKP